MHEDVVKELMMEMQRLKGVFRPDRGRMDIKPYEMALLHYVLHAQQEGKKAFPSQIGEELGFSRSFVAQILTNLENLGYISRNTQKNDRRMSEVVLTEKGLTLFQMNRNGFQGRIEMLVERLGEEDGRELVRLFRRVITIMNDLHQNKEE